MDGSSKELMLMSKQEINRAGILRQVEQRTLSQRDAARAMGVSDRQLRRLVTAYRRAGPAGIIHGLRNQPGNRRLEQYAKDEAIALVATLYSDFGPSFAAEKLAENHALVMSHETLRQLMIYEGLWKPKQRKVKHRQWRERKACYGEMEQFDGSLHPWFEDRAPKCTLLACRDDAGNVVRAQFVTYEGTMPVMAFWKRYFEERGKPQSIYLDRHSTYKVNAKGALDEVMLTQLERAFEELGIEVIHAYSPQAKGRIENLFGTFQDRLVKELRLAGISTIDEANVFLEEVFLPEYNRRFRVTPASAADLHWPVSSQEDLSQILAIQSQRLVSNDFTIRFKSHWFQLEKIQPTPVLPRTKVTVEERLDGSVRLRIGSTYLHYQELSARSAPMPVVVGSAKLRVLTKPAANHPWRKFTLKQSKPDISKLQGIGHF